VAKQRKRPARTRRDRKAGPTSVRRKPCPYCREKIDQVDYKDVSALRRFISERGKIRSRRITGACRRHQSQVARAVKRARACAVAVRRRGRERALGTRRAIRPWLAPRPVADRSEQRPASSTRPARRGTHGLGTSRTPTTPGSASSSRSRTGLPPLGTPLHATPASGARSS